MPDCDFSPRCYVDDRVGSSELIPLLPPGYAKLDRLDYGDVMWFGHGPDSCLVPVGLEIKRVHDLLTSMTDGRLAGHQLPGLQNQYSFVYLVIQGLWGVDAETGLITQPQGHHKWVPISHGSRRFMYTEVYGFLNTLTVQEGVVLLRTASFPDTALVVRALVRWWQRKPWDGHLSSKPRHVKGAPQGKAALLKPPLVRRVAAELPGIGWGKAAKVAAHFPSVLDMVLAREADWVSIPGVGKKLASWAVRSLQGEREEEIKRSGGGK